MNGLYDAAREGFLGGDLDWLGVVVRVTLIDLAEYAPDFELDASLVDIPNAARVATSLALTGKTTTAGVARADGVYMPSVHRYADAFIIWQDSGDDATSRPIAFVDNSPGFPVVPPTNVQINWDVSNGVFKL